MSISQEIYNFLWNYFIRPMYTREGYNPYNTLVYGFLLGLGIILTYDHIIKRFKIKVDERLIYATAPMVVFGSTMRALVDGKVLNPNPLILTPGIFFTAFFLILPALVADVKLKKYPKITVSWGLLLSTYPLYLFLTNMVRPQAYALTLLYTVLFSVPVVVYYKFKPFDRVFFLATLAHMYDLASTVVAIYYYNHYEVHWIEGILSEHFGPFILYPWKLLILGIVYYGVKYLIPNENERKYWYFATFVLGFAPGVRDPTQLTLGA
ncbi:hypothetical protein PAP_06830 [Palaeococcus pacificus DY20341]|uniref:Uncharacterized protein n=1 Tax=Palaeococcus pacificus DY20341 TaxID=1343739 RepID=A0A075LUE6_9EURY|nr:DUF63 family protein [Palaeococcus pacificus]AIF69761.1 hypothetical protein PAP_06830 [Palaeococcus pacificus DY20341]